MHLGFTTGNVIQKFIPETYNIVYYPQNNLFDYLIGSIGYNNYIFTKDKLDCHIDNMTHLPNEMISLYNYNLSITNNILGYSTNNIKQFHINSLIFTHSHKPAHIKKEDTALIEDRLIDEHKIFFTESSRQSWRLSRNTYVYKYGVPEIFKYDIPFSQRKEVLILDMENTTYAKHIYQTLKNANIQAEIINQFNGNIFSLNDIFNKYKICIDLAEHNLINLLCGIGSGCYGITIKNPHVYENYKSIKNLEFVNNLDDTLDVVKNLLSSNLEDSAQSGSLDVKSMFSYEQFVQNTKNIIQKANNEVFVL